MAQVLSFQLKGLTSGWLTLKVMDGPLKMTDPADPIWAPAS